MATGEIGEIGMRMIQVDESFIRKLRAARMLAASGALLAVANVAFGWQPPQAAAAGAFVFALPLVFLVLIAAGEIGVGALSLLLRPYSRFRTSRRAVRSSQKSISRSSTGSKRPFLARRWT